MKLQDTKVNCGPTALANALEALGHTRSVQELTKLCKTDATNGTSTRNLVAAIRHLRDSCGLDEHEIISTSSAQAAWALLFGALHSGRAAVLVVDAQEHYVAACGLLGQRALLVDSADAELVASMTREDLLERWDSGTGRFWAVVL